jgi:hypothetical protein
MNAHTFPLPPSPTKGEGISLPWTAVVEPVMGLWEPVILPEGDPATWNSPGLARAYASGRRGARDIFIGYSTLPPSVERIREIANPPRTPSVPVSFNIEAMDAYGAPQQRSSFDSWGR